MGKLKYIRVGLLLAVLCFLNITFLSGASASTLTHGSIIEIGGTSNANPMVAADGQAFAVAFTAATTAANNVLINFNPAGSTFTTNSGVVNGTQTVNNTDGVTCQSLTGATNGLPTGTTLTAAGASTTVTISGVSALTAGQSYCTFLTSVTAITNPSTGVYPVTITTGSDSETTAIDVVSSGANAVSVTGTVLPSFTMSLGGSTDALGSLSYSAVTTSPGITTTVNTNALSGWFIWAEDSNAGLHSTTASSTIPSVSTGSNVNMGAGGDVGSADYALGVVPGVGATAAANYVYTSNHGGGLQTGTYNQIASSTTPSNAVTITTHELADIAASTPAATDYTDTITLIGAGSF